jgi:hypothetical protein
LFATAVLCWPGVNDWSLNGPVPIGFEKFFAPFCTIMVLTNAKSGITTPRGEVIGMWTM